MVKKDKITITHISERLLSHKGFDEIGCFGCPCKDACCRFGADIDKESYDLIWKNKAAIETLIKRPLSECFEKEWSGDPEYLGGNSIRSTVNKKGFCSFHMPDGKGCALYFLLRTKNIDRRLIPSICRLFPITWENGNLSLYSELPEHKIPKTCNTVDPNNVTKQSIYETQQKEIEDIFTIIPKKKK